MKCVPGTSQFDACVLYGGGGDKDWNRHAHVYRWARDAAVSFKVRRRNHMLPRD